MDQRNFEEIERVVGELVIPSGFDLEEVPILAFLAPRPPGAGDFSFIVSVGWEFSELSKCSVRAVAKRDAIPHVRCIGW